jgi:hypothetical protein
LEVKPNANISNLNQSAVYAEGYVRAIKALESQDVDIIAAPGADFRDPLYSAVFNTLISQVENATASNGLRRAVIEASGTMYGRQAKYFTDKLNSSRVIFLNGHVTFAGNSQISYNRTSALGIYCGFLATRSPQISPATAASGTPQGILSCDVKTDPESLNGITLARAETIYYDSTLKRFKFLNGLTTSLDPNYRYVSVRRLLDQIIADLYYNLKWVQSESNTRALQAKVATACDAYLQNKMRQEWLTRLAPTICGPENNTVSDMAAGILNIRIRLTPVFPADFIKVHLINDLTEDFSLSTATN